jgi:hypothetical protein
MASPSWGDSRMRPRCAACKAALNQTGARLSLRPAGEQRSSFRPERGDSQTPCALRWNRRLPLHRVAWRRSLGGSLSLRELLSRNARPEPIHAKKIHRTGLCRACCWAARRLRGACRCWW